VEVSLLRGCERQPKDTCFENLEWLKLCYSEECPLLQALHEPGPLNKNYLLTPFLFHQTLIFQLLFVGSNLCYVWFGSFQYTVLDLHNSPISNRPIYYLDTSSALFSPFSTTVAQNVEYRCFNRRNQGTSKAGEEAYQVQ
jgi:hypothetical protein